MTLKYLECDETRGRISHSNCCNIDVTCAAVDIHVSGSEGTGIGRQFCSYRRLGYRRAEDVHQVGSL